MNISNISMYNLEKAIVASGYPMLTEYDPCRVMDEVSEVKEWIETYYSMKGQAPNKHIQRAIRLCQAHSNSGHCNFLSGILVTMDVTASNVWWLQCGRYHFIQNVSSMSKMHKLKAMRAAKDEHMFHPKVSTVIQNEFFDDDVFSDVNEDEELSYSCPMGMLLTAHISTNYLQLRTVYEQRKNHKLSEWRMFCNMISTLPFGPEFITQKF